MNKFPSLNIMYIFIGKLFTICTKCLTQLIKTLITKPQKILYLKISNIKKVDILESLYINKTKIKTIIIIDLLDINILTFKCFKFNIALCIKINYEAKNIIYFKLRYTKETVKFIENLKDILELNFEFKIIKNKFILIKTFPEVEDCLIKFDILETKIFNP